MQLSAHLGKHVISAESAFKRNETAAIPAAYYGIIFFPLAVPAYSVLEKPVIAALFAAVHRQEIILVDARYASRFMLRVVSDRICLAGRNIAKPVSIIWRCLPFPHDIEYCLTLAVLVCYEIIGLILFSPVFKAVRYFRLLVPVNIWLTAGLVPVFLRTRRARKTYSQHHDHRCSFSQHKTVTPVLLYDCPCALADFENLPHALQHFQKKRPRSYSG